MNGLKLKYKTHNTTYIKITALSVKIYSGYVVILHLIIKKIRREKMLDNCNDVLTVKELKEVLRIGFNKVYELIKNGDIKSIRVGNKIIVPKTAVLEYLQTAA